MTDAERAVIDAARALLHDEWDSLGRVLDAVRWLEATEKLTETS